MTGDDLITLAGQLVTLKNLGNAEARYRSAVSRAYYGAFHLVAEFLEDVGLTLHENHESHQQAYVVLLQTGHSDAADAGRALSDLRTARNRADYKLSNTRYQSVGNTMQDVGLAADVKSYLNKCREEPAFTEIRESIKNKKI